MIGIILVAIILACVVLALGLCRAAGMPAPSPDEDE